MCVKRKNDNIERAQRTPNDQPTLQPHRSSYKRIYTQPSAATPGKVVEVADVDGRHSIGSGNGSGNGSGHNTKRPKQRQATTLRLRGSGRSGCVCTVEPPPAQQHPHQQLYQSAPPLDRVTSRLVASAPAVVTGAVRRRVSHIPAPVRLQRVPARIHSAAAGIYTASWNLHGIYG